MRGPHKAGESPALRSGGHRAGSSADPLGASRSGVSIVILQAHVRPVHAALRSCCQSAIWRGRTVCPLSSWKSFLQLYKEWYEEQQLSDPGNRRKFIPE